VFLLLAAASKVIDLSGFRAFLTLHSGLSLVLATAVAAVLPWLELICGLCVVSGRAAREAALIALVMLAVFVVHGLIHPIEGDCGCLFWPARFAPAPRPGWLAARNLFLMACAVRVAFWPVPEPRRPEGGR
jgi:uncharacterized membrane protein YphA (DoxX/SURF4 family)